MASLREIRKKLRSIKNIQQLTSAMEMVAASRLRHAMAQMKHSLIYGKKLKTVLDNVLTTINDFTHPLLQQRKTKKIGLVVLAADMGLSGSYNHDIFKTVHQFLNSYEKDQVELIVVGHKTVEHFNRRDWPIRMRKPHLKEVLNAPEIDQLADELVALFLDGHCDEIWVAYTHYISIVSRKVAVEKLLHIESLQTTNTRPLDYIFEPSPTEVLEDLFQRYTQVKLQGYVYESYASELSARIFAMKAATHNAEEMTEKLTTIRNKVRQADITKEMLEIIAGSESLK